MTVKELIEELKKCDENLEVYAEGEPADRVLVETFKGEPQIVRIFKAWDIDFVNSPLADIGGEPCGNTSDN